MSKRDSASRRGSVELESGLSSSRLSPVSDTEDFINSDRDKRLDELSRPMLPPSRASQRGGDVTAETSSPPRRKPIPALVIIPVWITLSGCVILLNKYIFSTLKFPYPVFLTAYHMSVATIGTRLLRLLPGGRLKPAELDIPWSTYTRTILPLACLFSASLILANIAYVYLSVSFVQILKAFIPILTLVIQLLARLQEYNHLLLGIILVTSVGCSIAATGEIRFSMFGFLCQVAAVIVESSRLVLIQILLKDYKMDPLASISLYAPLCVGMIGFCIPIMEGLAPLYDLHKVGLPIMLLNGLLAFSLNVAGVFLIDSAGSLVLTLSGVFKDILLITFSVVLLGSPITGTQIFGYTLTLGAITTFKLTGGNPESPLAQKMIRTLGPLTESIRYSKARPLNSTSMCKLCMFFTLSFVFLGSFLLYQSGQVGGQTLSST